MAPAAGPNKRRRLWIDLLQGEPIGYEEMLDDLAAVRVVYLGERHTVARHHEIQARIVTDLGRRGVPLVLGLEQMESVRQADLDRYAKGQITFDQLAQATDWGRRWRGYAAYRPILEAARKAGAAILGLNAKSETIRQIARSGGIEKLPAETAQAAPRGNTKQRSDLRKVAFPANDGPYGGHAGAIAADDRGPDGPR